jgi:hypothetical protein
MEVLAALFLVKREKGGWQETCLSCLSSGSMKAIKKMEKRETPLGARKPC